MHVHLLSRLALSFIAAVVAFILLDASGYPLAAVFNSQSTAAWVQAIGSVAAIGASVWIVQRQHLLDQQRASELQVEARVELINGAMLVLKSQWEEASSFHRQLLAGVRDHPERHLVLRAAQQQAVQHLILDQKAFSFLLGTPAQDAFMEMLLAHNTFHTAMQVANERSALHSSQFQSRIEESGLNLEKGATTSEVAAAVGQRINYTLKQLTDDLYSEMESSIARLSAVGTGAPVALRKLYPGRRIVGFAAPRQTQ
jgi:hypothetical protein